MPVTQMTVIAKLTIIRNLPKSLWPVEKNDTPMAVVKLASMNKIIINFGFIFLKFKKDYMDN